MITKSKDPKLIWYISSILLILAANLTLYRWPLIQPISEHVAIASLFDFLIVIPLLTYFLIIRKRYSLNYIGLAVIAGYGAAYFIIPNEHLRQYSFINYIIGLSEGLLLLVELFIFYKIIKTLPSISRTLRHLNKENTFFLQNIKRAATIHLPGNKGIEIFVTEIALFYYSFFCWRKKTTVSFGQPFIYHKKTSVIAVYVMLIHATVLESVGFHYLLHQMNEILAYILLFLNVYTVLFFIAEIQATRLTPFLLTRESLLLQVGLSKSLEVPLNQIAEFKDYDGPEKFSRQESNSLFDARVMDFIQEKPSFEILLKEPQKVTLMYGITRRVDRIVLNVDEPNVFKEELKKGLIGE